MQPARTPAFHLGSILVQPALNQLVKEGVVLRLPPKFMQVLVCLARQPGELVTRDELLEAVWPDIVVGEAVLTRAISELRKAFDDDPQQPQVIETILKSGYRLIAPVTAAPLSLDGREAPLLQDVTLTTPPVRPHTAQRRIPAGRWWIGLGMLLLLGLGVIWRWSAGTPAPPAGLVLRPLTSLPGEEFDPALSPDGQQVVFAWHPEDTGEVDLYVAPMTGGAPRRLTTAPTIERYPAWSPDGRFVAFIQCDRAAQTVAVWTVPAAGGPPQHLADLHTQDCFAPSRLSWSPDGRLLAVADLAPAQPGTRIVLLATGAAERQDLTQPPEGMRDLYPVFSPDGRHLAFLRQQGTSGMASGGDLMVVPLPQGEPMTLTRGGFEINALGWLPDGQALRFLSRNNLWTVPLRGGAPRWMSTTGANLSQMTTSQQAAALVFTQTGTDTNLWRLPLAASDTSQAVRLVAATRTDTDPQVSPDGQRLAFFSDSDGACSLWLSHADGTQPVPLVRLDVPCHQAGMPRWSPSGQHLAYVSWEAGHADVYVASVASGTTRRLTTTPSEDTAPGWSHDGQGLYFSSDRDGTPNLWKMPWQGGTPVQVTRNGGYRAMESPDRVWVYFTKSGQPGLWRIPAVQGQEEQISTAPEPDDAAHWRVSERGIYYLVRSPTPSLALFDPETRQERLLRPLPATLAACSSFDIAPDASWAVFALVDHRAEDLLVLEPSRPPDDEPYAP